MISVLQIFPSLYSDYPQIPKQLNISLYVASSFIMAVLKDY